MSENCGSFDLTSVDSHAGKMSYIDVPGAPSARDNALASLGVVARGSSSSSMSKPYVALIMSDAVKLALRSVLVEVGKRELKSSPFYTLSESFRTMAQITQKLEALFRLTRLEFLDSLRIEGLLHNSTMPSPDDTVVHDVHHFVPAQPAKQEPSQRRDNAQISTLGN